MSLSGQLGLRSVQEAYDVLAADYAARLPDTRAEAPIDLAMVDAFAEAVLSSGDPRVLDAGCGTGRMSRYLTDRDCRVEGVDLSPGMVAVARRTQPRLVVTVATLTDLPYADDQFAGVLLWYSTIHTPPHGQTRIFAEVRRVLRPAGHVLIGFQSGGGTRKVSAAYRQSGPDIELERHMYAADEVASLMHETGLREQCRMLRRARANERDDQAVLLARAD
jgi:SAM-dependent methyltransferase